MGEFNGIFGVAVDPIEARIVVTDCHNHRVQVFSSDGQFLFYFGRKGEGSGEFQCPTGVAIDVRGQIIVCERLSYRLQVRKHDDTGKDKQVEEGRKREGKLLGETVSSWIFRL